MRLIDAEVFEELFYQQMNRGLDASVAVDDALQDTPTADAVPVVHARWIEKRMAGDIVSLQCSMCGNYENPSKVKGNYCWQCGARMDG